MAQGRGVTPLAAPVRSRGLERATDRLGLAAAPTFALMALVTFGAFGAGSPPLLCSAMPGGSILSGMAPMYALMAAFHCGPWLRLISRCPTFILRRDAAG